MQRVCGARVLDTDSDRLAMSAVVVPFPSRTRISVREFALVSPSSPRARRRFVCETCGGRGWRLRAGAAWADPCGSCSGRGSFSLFKIAKAIGEDPATLRRLVAGKVGAKVGFRLLEKLVRLAS